MAKPKLPKKIYVTSESGSGKFYQVDTTLAEAKGYLGVGDRLGVYELVKEVNNPKS